MKRFNGRLSPGSAIELFLLMIACAATGCDKKDSSPTPDPRPAAPPHTSVSDPEERVRVMIRTVGELEDLQQFYREDIQRHPDRADDLNRRMKETDSGLAYWIQELNRELVILLVCPEEALKRPAADAGSLREQLFELTHQMLLVKIAKGKAKPYLNCRYRHEMEGYWEDPVSWDKPLHVSDWLIFPPPESEFGLAIRQDTTQPWRLFVISKKLLAEARTKKRLAVPTLSSLPPCPDHGR